MTLPEAFGTYWRSEATLAIAHYTAAKLFWCYETQGVAAPFATFRVTSMRRMAVDAVRAGAPREYSLEVIHFAESQSGAWDGAEALLADVDGFAGLMPSTGIVRVKRCYVAEQSDLVSEAAAASGLFAVVQTITIII